MRLTAALPTDWGREATVARIPLLGMEERQGMTWDPAPGSTHLLRPPGLLHSFGGEADLLVYGRLGGSACQLGHQGGDRVALEGGGGSVVTGQGSVVSGRGQWLVAGVRGCWQRSVVDVWCKLTEA